MLRNIIFILDFCYFKDISDKVTVDDNVTSMMALSLIFCVDYCLLFFVTKTWYKSQNLKILQYYFHYIIQQLMKMKYF